VTTEVTNTVLGAITADDADSVTVKTDGQSATLGAVVFTTGAISADAAQDLTFTAGSNGELVTGAITSTSNAVDTITLTASDDAILDITSIDVSGSDLSSLTVTAGIGGRIDEGTNSTTVLPITADTIEAATITIGAAASAALDLTYGGTTTISMTTGSTLDLDNVGVASTTSSTTLTGRGTLQGELNLLGDASFNFSGLETGGAITLDINDDSDDKTVTTNRYDSVLDAAAGGDDTLTTGAGDDYVYSDNGGNKTSYATAIVGTISPIGIATVTVSFRGLTTSATTTTVTAAGLVDAIEAAVAADQTMSGLLSVTDGTLGAVSFTSLVEGTYAVKPSVSFAFSTSGSASLTVGAATAGTAGTGGDDTVRTNDGVDVVSAGSGDDDIGTGAGADYIIAGAGDDTISAGSGIDIIDAGAGADTIGGGTGLDTFRFVAGDGVPTIAGTGDAGTITGYDVISDYALGTASTNAETIDFADVTDAVLSDGATNGTDSTLTIGGVAVKSHSIASGMVTFDDADTYAAALTIDSLADVAAVVQYLQANDLGNAGATVAFTATLSGTTSTFVFQQGADAGTDTADNLIQLTGVTATSMSATNATTAGLIDIGA
jgi:hypothetical protein